jgi:hypothetical protein
MQLILLFGWLKNKIKVAINKKEFYTKAPFFYEHRGSCMRYADV